VLGKQQQVLFYDIMFNILVLRFIKDKYKDVLETTIGASYMCKTLEVGGQPIKFSVWDTAGWKSINYF
jgi:GTPase SAR1 family protein